MHYLKHQAFALVFNSLYQEIFDRRLPVCTFTALDKIKLCNQFFGILSSKRLKALTEQISTFTETISK